MIRALIDVKGYYDYGMFRPIQIAAIMALRHTDAAVEAQAAIYQSRRDVLCDGLERLGWPIVRPKATMFVWAKIPEPWASQMSSFDFAMKLLGEGDVAVSPGGGFGPAGEGYLRLARSRTRTAFGRPFGRSAAAWESKGEGGGGKEEGGRNPHRPFHSSHLSHFPPSHVNCNIATPGNSLSGARYCRPL